MARSRSSSSRSRALDAALSWLGWWIALAALWLLLVDTSQVYELVAGAAAAAVGATVVQTLRAQALLDFRLEAIWLARLWRAPFRIVVDFGLLLGALVRRRGGGFRTIPFDPESVGWSAFGTVAGTIAPNTIVVDVDADAGQMLVHDLDRARAQESPL